mgnify:FL=1
MISFRRPCNPYEKYGVDLVLQGHDHTYGRGHSPAYSKKGGDKGPTYVVSVSGPKMYDLGLDPWIERGASNTQLYQIIHVSEKSLKYEAFTATGELYDAFTLKKKSSGANKFKDQAPASVPERLELPKAFEARMTEQEKADYRKRFEAYMQRKK